MSLILSVKDNPNFCVEVENSIFLKSLAFIFFLNREEINKTNAIFKSSIFNLKSSIYLTMAVFAATKSRAPVRLSICC